MNNYDSKVENENFKTTEFSFIYFIGESITDNEIIIEAQQLFPDIDTEKIKLVLLHTLVTFESTKKLREELLKNEIQFHSVNSILIPATEYDITRFIISNFDTRNSIIRIRGGSWINAIAIATEVKYSTIVTGPSGFFKKFEFEDIPIEWDLKCDYCNNLINRIKYEVFQNPIANNFSLICENPNCERFNQQTSVHTGNLLFQEHPFLNNADNVEFIEPHPNEFKSISENWNMKCILCESIIEQYKVNVKGDGVLETQIICTNHECKNYNHKTTAYIKKPSKNVYYCFHCNNELKDCCVSILEDRQQLQLQYYCQKCGRKREFPIEYISF